MKTSPLFLPARRNRSTPLACGALLLGALLPLAAVAQPEQLEVGVRASVPDTTHLWSHDKNKIPGDGGHSRLYGILKVEQIKADWKLVKPVDENYITNLLITEMEANGFHQIVAGQMPEILITMSYGRGELANPYIRGQGEIVGLGALLPAGQNDPVPTQSINGAFPLELYDRLIPGHEQNLQKGQFEKLFLRVTAWSYPAKGEKTKMLWKTVMVVDDPDHRDLNIVAAKMLEAGAPYFDKEPKDKEVLLQKPLPTGRISFGTPEVVPPAAPTR